MHDTMIFVMGVFAGGLSFYISKRRTERALRKALNQRTALRSLLVIREKEVEVFKKNIRSVESECTRLQKARELANNKITALEAMIARTVSFPLPFSEKAAPLDSPSKRYIDANGTTYKVQGLVRDHKNVDWQTILHGKTHSLPTPFITLPIRSTFEKAQEDLDLYAKENYLKEMEGDEDE